MIMNNGDISYQNTFRERERERGDRERERWVMLTSGTRIPRTTAPAPVHAEFVGTLMG